MAIIKQNKESMFKYIPKGNIFSAKLTLYTRTEEGAEDPKEHYFIKTKDNKAVTLDKRTYVFFGIEDIVIGCTTEKKQEFQKSKEKHNHNYAVR